MTAAATEPDPVHEAWDAVESRRDGDAYDRLRRLPDADLLVIAAVGDRLASFAREVWEDRSRY